MEVFFLSSSPSFVGVVQLLPSLLIIKIPKVYACRLLTILPGLSCEYTQLSHHPTLLCAPRHASSVLVIRFTTIQCAHMAGRRDIRFHTRGNMRVSNVI